MVRTTWEFTGVGNSQSLHDLSAPRPKHGRRARAPERMTLGTHVMFVVHTGSSSRTGGGDQEHGEEKSASTGSAKVTGLPACLPAHRPGDFARRHTHARTAAGQRTFPSGSRLMRFPEAGARGVMVEYQEHGTREKVNLGAQA